MEHTKPHKPVLIVVTAPLAIGGRLIDLDTSDLALIDYAALFAQLHFVAQVQ